MYKKCQVFTPQDYVERLLDSVNYRQCLYGKRLLENSCGDGNKRTTLFLCNAQLIKMILIYWLCKKIIMLLLKSI